MDRKQFLEQIGLGSAAILVGMCMGGCSKTEGGGTTTPPSSVDFTLDLTSATYSALNTTGGFIYKDGLIVAKTVSGTFIAVAAACTHQGKCSIPKQQQQILLSKPRSGFQYIWCSIGWSGYY